VHSNIVSLCFAQGGDSVLVDLVSQGSIAGQTWSLLHHIPEELLNLLRLNTAKLIHLSARVCIVELADKGTKWRICCGEVVARLWRGCGEGDSSAQQWMSYPSNPSHFKAALIFHKAAVSFFEQVVGCIARS
jgi:hypothetical protein